MTTNERFYNCMHYLPVDHVLDMEFGYWDEVHTLWQKEGLPEDLDTHEKLEMYFGLEQCWRPPVKCMLMPEFEEEELEIRDGMLYFYDHDHVLCRKPADNLTTMPEHLEYPLKSRADWEGLFKPRLDTSSPDRGSPNLSDEVDDALAHNFMPWLSVGSLFGRLRNFAGFEGICYLLYDDPELVDEIIGHMADLTCDVLEKTLPAMEGKVKIADFWEDICFNTGPMISPAFFAERVVPRYRQITEVLGRFGIDTIIVDCDGWVGPLIEGFLAGGVNVMFPLERAGGSDPVMLRETYGEELLLLGGVDKRVIAKGDDEIVRQLETLAPLAETGGFIPHCDHRCPADVTLAKYRYYLKAKREIFGIPTKEEKIRKTPMNIS
ncbi:uroporphyrinogen decarboxylase family protein [Candidatus Latescibacterota bacterium]